MFGYLAFGLGKKDTLRRADFRRMFGVDVAEAYPRALEKLETLGALEVRRDSVVFQSQRTRDRLRDLLFFAPSRRRRELAAVAVNERRRGAK